MKSRYWLGRLGNEELLAALKALVRQDNELTADLLAHLAELDQRKLFLELGFPSLFAYCTESLGLSESSAGRRITAARVAVRFPGVFAAVSRGDLNLSILCALNPHLNHENAAELFEVCSNKKRQQVEEILAARFPRPDVRESIRRLPVRVVAEAEKTSSKPIIATPSNPPHGAKARVEPLSVDRYGVHFTADGEFRDLLEAARALASHRVPAGNIAELMKLALKALIRETEKRRFAVGRKPRAARADAAGPVADQGLLSPGESPEVRSTAEQLETTPAFSEPRRRQGSRHIPAAVAREVYVRDQGSCSFISADGRRCNARVLLEVDHDEPFAVGGAPTVSNLRLRCQAHNQLHARRYFGGAYVAVAIKRRRVKIREVTKTRGAEA